MPIAEKKLMLRELRDFLEKGEAVFAAEYSGIGAEVMNSFRKNLKKEGASCRVFKNSMLGIALEDEPWRRVRDVLSGPTLLVSAADDPVKTAKVVSEFAEAHKGVVLKGGVMERSFVSGEAISRIAKLPPAEVLISKLLGGFSAPLVRFVSVLNAPLGTLAGVLNLISKQTGGDNDGREGN